MNHFLFWLVIYTIEYFDLVYLHGGYASGAERLIGCIMLGASCLVVYGYASFIFHVMGRKRSTALFLLRLLPAVVYGLAGSLFLLLGSPRLERILHFFYFFILAVYSLFVILRHRLIAEDMEKRATIPFFFLSALFFLVFLLDFSVLHFVSFGNQYFPDGLITIPVYCLLWSGYEICRSLKTAYKVEGGEDSPVTEDFIKKHSITGREREIIESLLKGLSSDTIADNLFISHRTVDVHIYNIYKKCGVKNRIELINELQTHQSGGRY